MAVHFGGSNRQDLVSFLNRAVDQRRKKKRPKFLKNTFYSSYMIAVENALVDSIISNIPALPGEALSIEDVKGALSDVFTKAFSDYALSDQTFTAIGTIGQQTPQTYSESNENTSPLMENCIEIAKEGYPSDSNVIEKVQYLDHLEKIFSPSAYNTLMAEMEKTRYSLPLEIEKWQEKSTVPFSAKAVKWISKWLPTPGPYQ